MLTILPLLYNPSTELKAWAKAERDKVRELKAWQIEELRTGVSGDKIQNADSFVRKLSGYLATNRKAWLETIAEEAYEAWRCSSSAVAFAGGKNSDDYHAWYKLHLLAAFWERFLAVYHPDNHIEGKWSIEESKIAEREAEPEEHASLHEKLRKASFDQQTTSAAAAKLEKQLKEQQELISELRTSVKVHREANEQQRQQSDEQLATMEQQRKLLDHSQTLLKSQALVMQASAGQDKRDSMPMSSEVERRLSRVERDLARALEQLEARELQHSATCEKTDRLTSTRPQAPPPQGLELSAAFEQVDWLTDRVAKLESTSMNARMDSLEFSSALKLEQHVNEIQRVHASAAVQAERRFNHMNESSSQFEGRLAQLENSFSALLPYGYDEIDNDERD